MQNQSFTKSPTKKSPQKVAYKKMTSTDFEANGLTSGNVENLQINAVKMELQRERNTNESLEQDIAMLRE